MATVEELEQNITGLTTALTATNSALDEIDSKLDEIRIFIDGLSAGVVTQAQLDALNTLASAAKQSAEEGQAKATAALAEADALDE